MCGDTGQKQQTMNRITHITPGPRPKTKTKPGQHQPNSRDIISLYCIAICETRSKAETQHQQHDFLQSNPNNISNYLLPNTLGGHRKPKPCSWQQLS